jgi:hypothetical protein
MVFIYAVRLNIHPGYEDILSESVKRFDRMLCVYHTGKGKENPHWHMVIETEEVKSVDTLRKHLKKYFTSGKGNGHLSVIAADDSDKKYSYLFHEDDRDDFQIVINKGYSEDDIERYKKLNQEVQEKIKSNIPDKNLQEIYEASLQKFENQQVNSLGQRIYRTEFKSSSDVDHFYNKKRLFQIIMRHYIDKGDKWLPNRYQIERMIMKLQVMLCENKTDEDQFIDCQFNEWFSDSKF